MIASMNGQGRMAVVLPHGALFRKGVEGKIRQALIEEDMLEAVIGPGPTSSTERNWRRVSWCSSV